MSKNTDNSNTIPQWGGAFILVLVVIGVLVAAFTGAPTP